MKNVPPVEKKSVLCRGNAMTSQSGLQVSGYFAMPVTDGIVAYARIYNKQKRQQSLNWQPRVFVGTVQTVAKIQILPQWLINKCSFLTTKPLNN